MPAPPRIPRSIGINPEVDAAIERWAEATERGLALSAEQPLELTINRTGSSLRLALPERAVARITGGGTGGIHAWSEQMETTGGGHADLPGGRTGTTSADPAYEWNGNEEVAAGTIVEIEREPDTREWRFAAGTCPAP